MEEILRLQQADGNGMEEMHSWSTISNHHCGGGPTEAWPVVVVD
ncbi:hypothetical protein P4U65_28015 [Bacillus pacificus]|nr:hypothetical protein [Bacillus thuringiensis]MED1304305.1 hypothetical protein [Bacillus pacificus]